jgi:hypothetical protein
VPKRLERVESRPRRLNDDDAEARAAWAEAERDPGFRERLIEATEGMAKGRVTPYSEVRGAIAMRDANPHTSGT